MATLRVPPGRAGRVWLRDRLGIAESALSLLEQKQAILGKQLGPARARCARTAAEWAAACAVARQWQQRTALLGGRRALLLGASAQPARMTVGTVTLAGTTYPNSVELTLPQGYSDSVGAGAVLVRARAAHAAAIRAAAGHAVALAAVRALECELAATGLRARALRHRRIPALHTALAGLELTLEERERADRVALPRSDRAGAMMRPDRGSP